VIGALGNRPYCGQCHPRGFIQNLIYVGCKLQGGKGPKPEARRPESRGEVLGEGTAISSPRQLGGLRERCNFPRGV